LLASFSSFATHIVGGEMFYDFLGKNSAGADIYRVTLKVYRDCLNGQAPFDGMTASGGQVPAALITVREVVGNVVGVFDIGAPVITNVPKTINEQCIQTPNDACLEQGTYTYTVTLPPKAGGYYIIYQRCCRNNTIANIVLPGEQSSTYYTKIPGPEDAVGNSSPRFTLFPPIFLCGNILFEFDHSATDPDGDNLVYSFYAPFNGIDPCCSYIGNAPPVGPSQACPNPPSQCPQEAPPPPYAALTFISPYTMNNPMDALPALTLNSSTGKLSGKPKKIAQYVMGVKVDEYRNGILINTVYRDFQFNIRSCIVTVKSAIVDPKKRCRGAAITYTNASTVSTGQPTFHWDFGVSTVSDDTSNLPNPTYIYQDTGVYLVTLITNPGKTCSDTVRQINYIYPMLDISVDHPPVQCLVNNSFNFKPKGVYIADTKFTWKFDTSASLLTSNSKNLFINYRAAGLHSITLIGSHYSCTDTTYDTVRVLGRPKAIINNLPQKLCDPGIVYLSNGSTSDLPLKYYWTFYGREQSATREKNTVVTFSGAGKYSIQLKVVTDSVCKDSSTTWMNGITIHPLPVPQFTVTPRVTSIFEPEVYFDGGGLDGVQSSLFFFGDGSTGNFIAGKHVYAKPGTYKVTQTLTNYFGCSDSKTDSVIILPEFRFWIPNAFTPDDNGRNDAFGPVCMGTFLYVFEIFDRWGMRIFLAKDPEEKWNGDYKGMPCKQDIYTWRVSFRNAVTDKHEVRTGHFLLLRNP
jgi:gliding motility-associated-like protein